MKLIGYCYTGSNGSVDFIQPKYIGPCVMRMSTILKILINY